MDGRTCLAKISRLCNDSREDVSGILITASTIE